RFEVILEQMPKCRLSEFSDVRGIIDDDIEAVRRYLPRYPRQELWIGLTAFVEVNPVRRLEILRQPYVDPYDSAPRKIVAPQQKRSTLVNPDFAQTYVLPNPWLKYRIVSIEISIDNLV